MPSNNNNSKNNSKNNTAENTPDSNDLPSSSNTKINGTNADNVLFGDIHDEFIDGKAGNDQVNGGAGNDRVKGGSGDDIVDGGAGNDDVEAESGNDHGLYSVTDNTAATDTYDGGSGIDLLTLGMNRDEWMRDDVQADIARYLEFLDSHVNSGSGEADGTRFNFNAFDLEARKFESLGTTVDGVELNPMDEAVTTNDDTATTEGEHSVVSGNVLANDDVPDLVRSVELVSAPTLGSLSFDADGNWNYDPGNDFDSLGEGETAEVRFSYIVTDADHDADIGEVIITVTGTNDLPVAFADSSSIDENASVTFDVLANDTDVDVNDSHTLDAVSITSGLGSVSIQDNKVNWDPGSDYDYLGLNESASVEIAYTMSDQHGAEASSTLILEVIGSNDSPVAMVDTATTGENAAITVDVLANDTDVDANDTLSVDVVSVPAGQGVATIENNQVNWNPGTDFDYLAVGESTTVEIAYTISDQHGAESESTLTLEVIGSNDLPVVAAIARNSNEDLPLLQVELLSTASDVDASDALSINSLVQTAGRPASVTLVDSTLNFDPAQFNDLALGDTETLIFSFNVNDGHADVANEFSIAIEGRNDAPVVASVLTSNTNEQDEPYGIDLLGGASDADIGAILSAINIIEAEGQGGWSVAGNILTVDPDYFDDLDNGEFGTLNLSYQITDEHGEAVDQSLTVNVEGFTDAPSLEVVTSAGNAVNKVKLQITSAPATNERVMLSFSGLVAGAYILDDEDQNVTGGIADYVGTSEFTLVLPEDQNVKDDLEIKVTGVDGGGNITGENSQDIDISVDVVNRIELQNFSSEDQNMWGSGDNISVGWHEYFPFVGTDTDPWSSGEISLFDIHINSDDIAQDALVGLTSIRDTALGHTQEAEAALATTIANEERAELKVNHVTDVVAAWVAYDAKNLIYQTAKAAHDAAQALANNAGAVSNDLQGDLTSAQNVLSNLQSQRTSLYNDSQYTYQVWVLTPKWTDPFDGYWSTRTGTDPIKYLLVVAKDAEILVQKGVIGGIQTLIDLAEVGEDGLQAAADALKPPMDEAQAIKNTAYNHAVSLENAMHADGFYVGESVNATDVIAAGAEHAALIAEIPFREAVLLAAEGELLLAQAAVDAAQLALDELDFNADLDLSVALHAMVGLQVDFDLDLGSVDTSVEYQLNTQTQYNLTTDMLLISPIMTNMTTGDDVAFSTISPNAQFKAAILYDVGADLDIFVDAATVVSGTTIFDISPGANGITVQESLNMAGELVLIDLDTTDLGPIKVPGIADMTADVITLEVAIPTIETEGTAEDFDLSYFQEGGLINVDFSEISSAFFNFINAGIDFSPEIQAAFGGVSLDPGSDDLSSITSAVGDVLEGIWSVLNGDADTDGDGVIPIFLLDATDETASSLFHLNIIPDDVSTIDVDTASFGFYVAYGESDPVVKVNIDLDQFVALVANRVGGNTTNAIINPLVKEYGLDLLLDIASVPEATATEIKKYVNMSYKFEYADVDVWSAWKFKQEFTLSVDDMAFLVTMEDGVSYVFNANDEGNLLIENASQHDLNHDGFIDYALDIVPMAMFSNDTEVGLSLGYNLDFLKAQLDAGFSLPLADLVGIPALPTIPIPLLDLDLGPLLRVKGDLDILDVDLFESRFAIDVGSDSSSGLISAIDDVVIGTDGDDVLFGFEGNDILNAGAGNDLLSGGSGNNLFVFAANDGNDTIIDFKAGDGPGDILDLRLLGLFSTFNDVLAAANTDESGNTEIDYGDGNSITLLGVTLDDLHQDDVLA